MCLGERGHYPHNGKTVGSDLSFLPLGAGSPVIATWVSPWEAATRTSVLKQVLQLMGGSEASLPVEVMVMALK